MGRVINLEGAGKDRKRLTREVVLALQELIHQSEPNSQARDLAAFIALNLEAIYQTIDLSVAAWEKRGYWVKADRFRLEWAWSERLARTLKDALLADNWSEVAVVAAQVGEKLSQVRLPEHHRLGTPWIGAWEKLKQKYKDHSVNRLP